MTKSENAMTRSSPGKSRRKNASSRSPRRASQPAANSGVISSHRNEIGAVVAIGIVAALGVLLWRGRDSLPEIRLPALPAPDDVRNTVQRSWKSAMQQLPTLDGDKLAEVTRGFDALRSLFSRA